MARKPNNHRQNSLFSSLSMMFMTITTICCLVIFTMNYCAVEQTEKTSIISNNSPPQKRNVDYSLANEQSFGFFTDISNTNWQIAQRYHANLFPNYYADLKKFSNGPNDKGKVKNLARSNMWYGQVRLLALL